jgi:HD superfamily phosphodiesterase
MNTKSAQLIAEERHRFMEIFLEQFFEEWSAAQ